MSGFTPIELACVKPQTVFKGHEIRLDTEERFYGNDVTVQRFYYGDERTMSAVVAMDLAFHTSGATSTSWEMIVGETDQLDASNIRYYVICTVTDSEDWLIPNCDDS